MAAAELSAPTARSKWSGCAPKPAADGDPARRILACAFVLAALTMFGALVAAVVPNALPALRALLAPVDSSLLPTGQPHPVLLPSLAATISILGTNLRVLAAPFILVEFRFPSGRRACLLGDLILGGILAGNALRVGLALGRWQAELIPYLPQLPLEYLAASAAAAAWLDARQTARHGERPDQRTTASYAALTALLLTAAAVVEVLLTPHAR